MVTQTPNKILSYIQGKKQATPNELLDYLGISRAALFRHLKNLVETGRLVKVGQSPKVFYVLPHSVLQQGGSAPLIATPALTAEQRRMINERYLYVSAFGEMTKGVDGFIQWCNKTKQPVEKTAGEYLRTLQKYDQLRKNGLLDGTTKLRSTFDIVSLNRLWYVDFYSIERFGKTKLGQMLLYAKQSQNKKLMKQVSVIVRPHIVRVLKQYHIDAVGFIPPTVKRAVQFMTEFAKQLELTVPVVSILKMISDIPVPQKTLSRVEDRIENARRTIIVDEPHQYRNVLLVDDAVGSGATLNETATKLKQQHIATGSIIGFSITGSYKGFDVISEI